MIKTRVIHKTEKCFCFLSSILLAGNNDLVKLTSAVKAITSMIVWSYQKYASGELES